MATVPIDERKVAHCRALAADIADDVQRYIDAHTTRRRRAHHRCAPTASTGPTTRARRSSTRAVDRYHEAGLLGRGIASSSGARSSPGAASRAGRRRAPRLRARARPRRGRPGAGRRAREALAAAHRRGARAHRPRPRRARGAARRSVAAGRDAAQVRHRRHRQHLRRRRPGQGRRARAGADIVAVIRATAQSLLDYVPARRDDRGLRRHLRHAGELQDHPRARSTRRPSEHGRYIHQTNYSSGLCMAEIAWMAAVERLDMLLNDAMYGILFRDINMCRTFVDQYVSRRFIARAGIVINTGEDNYLTTADAVEKAHTVLASQFINEAFAHARGPPRGADGPRPRLRDRPVARGHASCSRSRRRSSSGRSSTAHPIKWMPPTKHKTGDIFFAPRARRDVQPRRRHDRPVDRAPRHVQRGDPQPAAHGPLPRR